MVGCPNSTSITGSCGTENSTAFKSTDFQSLLAVHVFLLIASIITVLLNIVSIILVIVTRPILKQFKILLVNLLAADIAASVAVVLNMGTGIVLISKPVEDPSLEICKLIAFMFLLGVSSRMWSLVAFSVTMFFVVVRGVKKLKMYHVLLAAGIIWLAAFITTVDKLIPQVNGVTFANNVTCIPVSRNEVIIQELRITFRVIWNVLRGALLIISSILPIALVCYLRKVTISRSSLYCKILPKLAPFLLLSIAELFTFLSLLLVTILTFLIQHNSIAETDAVFIGASLLTGTVVPTPILVLIFVKIARSSTGSGCNICLRKQPNSEEHEPSYHIIQE